MSENIGVLVETGYCVGCYACQSACQDYNNLSVHETYLRCVLVKPEYVDGDPVSFMSPVPYKTSKCAECLDKEGVAPCSKICIGRCLHIDAVDKLLAMAGDLGSGFALYC